MCRACWPEKSYRWEEAQGREQKLGHEIPWQRIASIMKDQMCLVERNCVNSQ